MEANAALMQRIRAVRLDGTGEKPLLGGAQPVGRVRIEPVARLQQGGGLEREANPIGLLEALLRAEHRRKGPAVSGAALGPAFLGGAA